MQTPPVYTELADKAGISLSYASEIVNSQRDPSIGLAAHIFASTGWKHPRVAMLGDDAIRALAVAPKSRAA